MPVLAAYIDKPVLDTTRLCLLYRFSEAACLNFPTFKVEFIQSLGEFCRAIGVARRQQFSAKRRLTDPPAGVDPRTKNKSKMVGNRRFRLRLQRRIVPPNQRFRGAP